MSKLDEDKVVDELDAPLALLVRSPDEPGALHALTGVFLEHEANIVHVDIAERREGLSTVYFELEDVAEEAADALIDDLEVLPIVTAVERSPHPEGLRKRICVVAAGRSWPVVVARSPMRQAQLPLRRSLFDHPWSARQSWPLRRAPSPAAARGRSSPGRWLMGGEVAARSRDPQKGKSCSVHMPEACPPAACGSAPGPVGVRPSWRVRFTHSTSSQRGRRY